MARDLLVSLAVSGSTIHSSITPATTFAWARVSGIINGFTQKGWQYMQGGALLDFPVWAIIDLGDDYFLSEIEIYGASYLWQGIGCPRQAQIQLAETPLYGTPPIDSDYRIVWASSLVQPSRPGKFQYAWTNTAVVAIDPQWARYIKILVNSTWAGEMTTQVDLAEVRVYAQINALSTITSNAHIEIEFDPTLKTITSYAWVLPPWAFVITSIVSNATFVWASGPSGPTVAEAAALTVGEITYMMEVYSNAEIIDVGMRMTSVATIAGEVTETISSDVSIGQSTTSFRNVRVSFPGSGSFKTLQGEGYDSTLFEQHVLVYSVLDSTSLETIVPDLFTSTVFDLNTVTPPFGYQNYDWSYDWIVRTFNQAVYLVEARSGNTLDAVNIAVFSTAHLGDIFSKGAVPRYHQWRLHVWASGSNDFEFHQFTLRGHVSHGRNAHYTSLIDDPFVTTNVINQTVPRIWEPTLSNTVIWSGSYIPGDVNSDGRVTGADVAKLIDYVYFKVTDGVNLLAADVNGDGRIGFADIAHLLSYISGSGPPPRIQIA